jgi:hypothetical protein
MTLGNDFLNLLMKSSSGFSDVFLGERDAPSAARSGGRGPMVIHTCCGTSGVSRVAMIRIEGSRKPRKENGELREANAVSCSGYFPVLPRCQSATDKGPVLSFPFQ